MNLIDSIKIKNIKKKNLKKVKFDLQVKKFENMDKNALLNEYIEIKVKHNFYKKIMFTFFVSILIAFTMNFFGKAFDFLMFLVSSSTLTSDNQRHVYVFMLIFIVIIFSVFIFIILSLIFKRFNTINRKLFLIEKIVEKQK